VAETLLSAVAVGLAALAQATAGAKTERPEAPRTSALGESIRRTLACSDPLRAEPASGCAARELSPGKRSGLPRFTESIEVIGHSPEALLWRYLADEELSYGPTASSAPTVNETEDHRPGPTQGANFVPILTWLARRARGPSDASPRFYVYELLGRDGRWPLLRDWPIASSGFSSAGLTWTLVGAFADWASARRAYEQLRAECREASEAVARRRLTAAPRAGEGPLRAAPE